MSDNTFYAIVIVALVAVSTVQGIAGANDKCTRLVREIHEMLADR